MTNFTLNRMAVAGVLAAAFTSFAGDASATCYSEVGCGRPGDDQQQRQRQNQQALSFGLGVAHTGDQTTNVENSVRNNVSVTPYQFSEATLNGGDQTTVVGGQRTNVEVGGQTTDVVVGGQTTNVGDQTTTVGGQTATNSNEVTFRYPRQVGTPGTIVGDVQGDCMTSTAVGIGTTFASLSLGNGRFVHDCGSWQTGIHLFDMGVATGDVMREAAGLNTLAETLEDVDSGIQTTLKARQELARQGRAPQSAFDLIPLKP